jgi:hypothetical protein
LDAHRLPPPRAVRVLVPPTCDLDGAVEMTDRFDRPQRERLVQRELVLEVEVDPDTPAERVGGRRELEEFGVDERSVDRDGAADVLPLPLAWLVVLDEEAAHRPAAIARAVEQAHDHLVVDVEARGQGLGFAADQLVERVLRPVHVTALGRLLLHGLLLARVGLGLLGRALVLDHVRRRLNPDVTPIVETAPPGTPGDLLELADAKDPRAAAVVLAELGEQNGPDRDVHADAQGVGPADDLQQAGLCEALDEQAVFGEQTGVMDADATNEESPEGATERRVEPEPTDQLLGAFLLVLGERIQAEISLSCLGRVTLREVDEVDRGHPGRQQLFDRPVESGRAVLEVERDRAL